MNSPFTIWTRAVRFRRIPVNDNKLNICISVTESIHDAGWVGIQEMTTDCPFFSWELFRRAPDVMTHERRVTSTYGYIVK